VSDDDRIMDVQRQLFLRTLTPQSPMGSVARQMARAMREVHFEEGKRLFSAGTTSGEVFYVVRGEVHLEAPSEPPWHFTPPSIIGAIDALNGRPHARTAVAKSDVHALAIRSEEWLDGLEENFDFARDTLMRVSSALTQLHLELPPDGGFAEPVEAGDDGAHALNLVERIVLLQSVPVFDAATVQAISRLAEVATEREFDPGQVLHRSGDPSDGMLFVASGVVEVVSGEGPDAARVRAAFGPGSQIGGAPSLGDLLHTYTAVAPAGAAVLSVGRESFFDIMEDHFDLVRSMMMGLTREREVVLNVRARRAEERRAAGEDVPRTQDAMRFTDDSR
jgi:CRP-like cAMP-binding protein